MCVESFLFETIMWVSAVRLAGNALREDFTFRHTFSSEVSNLLKASPGQVVVVQPEKFRSKYEPASHKLTIKVFLFIYFFCRNRVQWLCDNVRSVYLNWLLNCFHKLWKNTLFISLPHYRTVHWCRKYRSSSRRM